MDELERRIFFAAASWLLQTNNSNAIAAALATLFADTEPIWPWKPFKRIGPIQKLIDVWLPEEEGGLNDEYFEFFTRFTKDEVRKLAQAINPPTKFAINPRSGWPNASTASPEESLLVFLWRCAHPLSLGYLIPFFRRSRP